jgi:hypothetical protein
MTVMEPGSEILKVDEVGRVQTPPEKREALLAEYDRRGMTGAQFARFSGVRYATLMYWLQRRRKEAGRGQQVTTPGRIIRVGWKREWREKSRSQRTSWWKWKGGFACLLLTAHKRRWGELLRAMGLGGGC